MPHVSVRADERDAPKSRRIKIIPIETTEGETAMNILHHHSQQLFDGVYSQLANHEVAVGMKNLFFGLHKLKRSVRADEWRNFAQSAWLNHPVKTLVHQDPLTRRAFEKPRGYAGDAEL